MSEGIIKKDNDPVEPETRLILSVPITFLGLGAIIAYAFTVVEMFKIFINAL
jgi:hypothetical protein